MIRRTRSALMVTAALGVLLAGCGGSHDMSDMGAVSPSSTTGASAADAMFAQMMIPHHEQAVEMSTLAETRASSPEIQELAAQIKGAQQPEIDQMSAWLEEWGVPVMPMGEAMEEHGGHGMSGMLTSEQMQQLADVSGPEFDRLFAEFMILHHEGAIDMAEDVVDSEDPRVAALAAAILQTQAEEIARMQDFLEGSGSATEGDASASPSGISLSESLDHVHAAVVVDGSLLVGTHSGVVRVDAATGAVTRTGASRDDFMALAGSQESLVASGHPGDGSTLPDPVGLLRSIDAGETWNTVSLTGEIDFHALAVDGERVAGSATTGEMLYSEDAGATWAPIARMQATSLAWFDGRLWIADGFALFNWAPGDAAPADAGGGAAVLIAASSDGKRLWSVLADGTLLTSTDAASWDRAGDVSRVGALAASDKFAYVVTPEDLSAFPAR